MIEHAQTRVQRIQSVFTVGV